MSYARLWEAIGSIQSGHTIGFRSCSPKCNRRGQPVPPEHDFIHYFKKHPESEVVAKCRVRIYRPPSGAVVVIATELPDNPGVSITNWAEHLATHFRRLYAQQGEAFIWIEHYSGRCSRYDPDVVIKEEFDRVLMRWTGREYVEPDWKPFDRRKVEEFIGEPVGD
jgi:hypothetical protein